tara:strand:- start:1359 stop:2075 length:717 start_codon:yes stop_codon:yes gene_type:complete
MKRHPNETARDMSHQNFNTIIEESDLSPIDKTILKSRFLNEIMYYDYKRDNVKMYYNTLRFMVTTGSILLPAILSIGQMDEESLPDNFENILFWSSWGISLIVTASNGFIQLFSLDKKYYDYSLTTEQLKSEAWEYFQLSGKYEDYCDHSQPFRTFCNRIEKIKNGQISREFSGKVDDNNSKGECNNQRFMMANNIPNNIPNNIQEDKKSENIQEILKGIKVDIKEDKIDMVSEKIKE